MSHKILILLVIFCFSAIVWGCEEGSDDPYSSSDDDDDNDSSSDSDSDSDGDGDSDGDADDDDEDDDDSEDDDDNDDDTDDDVCAETDIEINVVPVRMMILQDISGSMVSDDYGDPLPEPTKWTQAKNAIASMVNGFAEDIEFGADDFPNNGSCGVGQPILSDTVIDNAANIISLYSAISPEGATPLYLALQNYTNPAYAPIFANGEADSYLVVISDGQDTCGVNGLGLTTPTNQQLAQVTANVLAAGIKTFVIGFGSGADPAQLNAIAAAGGTDMTQYIDAQDETELTEQLNGLASSVVSCVYEFEIDEDEEDVDMDEVSILFDGEELFYDQDCSVGGDEFSWTWVDDEQTQFEFCDAACAELESGNVETITITVGCPPPPIVQ